MKEDFLRNKNIWEVERNVLVSNVSDKKRQIDEIKLSHEAATNALRYHNDDDVHFIFLHLFRKVMMKY